MDRMAIDKVHNCLEILKVSGQIVLYIDDKPPVQTTINEDLRIFFYLADKPHPSIINGTSGKQSPQKAACNVKSEPEDQPMVSDETLHSNIETSLYGDSSHNEGNHDPVIKEEVSDSDFDASEENTFVSHLIVPNEEQNAEKSEIKEESNKGKTGGCFRLYKPKSCGICGKEFETSAEKEVHNLGPLPMYTCAICNLEFPCEAKLLIHEACRHPETNDLPKVTQKSYCHCPVCKKYIQKNAVLDHITFNHTKELKYKCCICGTLFYTRRQLNRHAQIHLNPGGVIKNKRTGQWKCSLCPEVFHDKGQFHKHAHSHRTKCVFCGKDLGHKQFLDLHYQKEHADSMLSCHICGKQMATQAQLAGHVRHHRYKKLTPCPVCGVLITAKFLPCHMEVTHADKAVGLTSEAKLDMKDQAVTTGVTNNEDVAPSTASTTPNSSSSVSTSENLFLCSHCPRTFPVKRYLNAHMYRFHGTEGKLPCPQCGKKLLNKSMLNRHIRNVHLKSNLFTCEICGKQCTVKTNLKIHMRVHSEDKCFTCKICNQGFNYKASLKSHMRSKHYKELVD